MKLLFGDMNVHSQEEKSTQLWQLILTGMHPNVARNDFQDEEE